MHVACRFIYVQNVSARSSFSHKWFVCMHICVSACVPVSIVMRRRLCTSSLSQYIGFFNLWQEQKLNHPISPWCLNHAREPHSPHHLPFDEASLYMYHSVFIHDITLCSLNTKTIDFFYQLCCKKKPGHNVCMSMYVSHVWTLLPTNNPSATQVCSATYL